MSDANSVPQNKPPKKKYELSAYDQLIKLTASRVESLPTHCIMLHGNPGALMIQRWHTNEHDYRFHSVLYPHSSDCPGIDYLVILGMPAFYDFMQVLRWGNQQTNRKLKKFHPSSSLFLWNRDSVQIDSCHGATGLFPKDDYVEWWNACSHLIDLPAAQS